MFELMLTVMAICLGMVGVYFTLSEKAKEMVLEIFKSFAPRFATLMFVALVFSSTAFAVDGTEVEWLAKLSAFLAMLPQYLDLLLGLLAAVIAIALVIPGEQPEKFLQSIVDFLSKFSKKPKQ